MAVLILTRRRQMIELVNVSKKYGNDILLTNLNFVFKDHNTYLLSGKSGIGKTTLLNMIAGYTAYTGDIVVSDRKSTIGYMFQEPLMFSNITVEDNLILKCIALKKRLSDSTVDHAISSVLKALGISDLRGKKVSTLSGGEKQRLQIAMLIFTKPDIILMDEPTANLDTANKILIYQIIEKIFPDTLKIIVSHDAYIAENAIKLTIREGQIEYV